jgi:hypothetical protein
MCALASRSRKSTGSADGRIQGEARRGRHYWLRCSSGSETVCNNRSWTLSLVLCRLTGADTSRLKFPERGSIFRGSDFTCLIVTQKLLLPGADLAYRHSHGIQLFFEAEQNSAARIRRVWPTRSGYEAPHITAHRGERLADVRADHRSGADEAPTG